MYVYTPAYRMVFPVPINAVAWFTVVQSTPAPANPNPTPTARAWRGLIAPRTTGLFFVRFIWESYGTSIHCNNSQL